MNVVIRDRLSRTAENLGVGPPGAHRFFFHHPLTEVYIPPTPYQLYYGSADEEIETYAQAGECLVLRRSGGPNYLRPEVVNGLKARGWVEQVDIQPARGFNVKIAKLCPPPAEPRISGLGRIVLAQGPPSLRVVVFDRRGEPAPGIGVVILAPYNVGEGTTDSDGAVLVHLPGKIGEAVVVATLPEGEMRQRVLLAPLGMQTVTFRSVRKIDGPVVTPVEGVAGAVGVGLVVLGAILGKTLGDIMTGIGGSVTAAAAYSAISRHV